MDEKKEFDFQPEKVGEAESTQVEKDYNFDLFTPNRGKNIDSGRLDREVKLRRETAKREKRAIRQKPKMEKAAPSELPTDIDTDIEFDNEQVFESEVEYNEPMLDAAPMLDAELMLDAAPMPDAGIRPSRTAHLHARSAAYLEASNPAVSTGTAVSSAKRFVKRRVCQPSPQPMSQTV